MSYKINDDCISCGACAPVCPQNCIHTGETKFEIDENECVECAACAEICPVGAPEAPKA